ncbi:MAG TPA: MarR family transcriptional regulator [Opitutaceae bacterium]|jgi:MarR family 2-MHQ and catechol resistance regulon transcriptional repressor|nr:MarR family transcriptional regulator [Opitutaceae bacterium]
MSNEPGYRLTAALLAAADALLRSSHKLFRPHGLTAAQFNVLNLLALGEPGMSQRELSDELVVDKSNVTGLVDRMEKAGWLRRTEDPHDRRIYRITLTPAGKKLWAKVNPLYLNAVRQVTSPLSPLQIRQCLESLETLRRSAADWEQ